MRSEGREGERKEGTAVGGRQQGHFTIYPEIGAAFS